MYTAAAPVGPLWSNPNIGSMKINLNLYLVTPSVLLVGNLFLYVDLFMYLMAIEPKNVKIHKFTERNKFQARITIGYPCTVFERVHCTRSN